MEELAMVALVVGTFWVISTWLVEKLEIRIKNEENE